MYNLLNKNGIKLARDRRERAAANYKSWNKTHSLCSQHKYSTSADSHSLRNAKKFVPYPSLLHRRTRPQKEMTSSNSHNELEQESELKFSLSRFLSLVFPTRPLQLHINADVHLWPICGHNYAT
jgi:hypothetical protein